MYVPHEVVLVDEVLGYIFDSNACVFRLIEWRSQVVVGDICTEKFCFRPRAHAVENSFDDLECPCLGSTVAIVCDGVTTNGDAGSVGVLFGGAKFTDNSSTCDVFVSVLWYFVEHDWAHGVGSFNSLFGG